MEYVLPNLTPPPFPTPQKFAWSLNQYLGPEGLGGRVDTGLGGSEMGLGKFFLEMALADMVGARST